MNETSKIHGRDVNLNTLFVFLCSCGRKRYGKRYYWCPGYMSGYKFYSCGFKAGREDIERRPWISNEQYILCVFPLVQNIVCDGKADISFGTMLCYYYVTCIIHLN